MKNIRNTFLGLILITSVTFLSCKKEDHLTPIFNRNAPSVNTATPGNTNVNSQNDWQITAFEINKTDQRKIFIDYMFVFGNNGVLKAVTKNSSMSGTWSVQKGTPETFIINFDSEPLNMLNNEWQVLKRTAYELKLERINRNGAPEYVIFQRLQAQPELSQIELPLN